MRGVRPTSSKLRSAVFDRLQSEVEGARVLDPFNGSGTTGVAATALGLEYVGIDLDTEYLDLTVRRLTDLHPDWNSKTA